MDTIGTTGSQISSRNRINYQRYINETKTSQNENNLKTKSIGIKTAYKSSKMH